MLTSLCLVKFLKQLKESRCALLQQLIAAADFAPVHVAAVEIRAAIENALKSGLSASSYVQHDIIYVDDSKPVPCSNLTVVRCFCDKCSELYTAAGDALLRLEQQEIQQEEAKLNAKINENNAQFPKMVFAIIAIQRHIRRRVQKTLATKRSVRQDLERAFRVKLEQRRHDRDLAALNADVEEATAWLDEESGLYYEAGALIIELDAESEQSTN